MSHRKQLERNRHDAAHALDEELAVSPKRWARAATNDEVRIDILDAILVIVGKQVVMWMDARHTEEKRSVMGQDSDGTPNGKDYTERRMVTDWQRQ